MIGLSTDLALKKKKNFPQETLLAIYLELNSKLFLVTIVSAHKTRKREEGKEEERKKGIRRE